MAAYKASFVSIVLTALAGCAVALPPPEMTTVESSGRLVTLLPNTTAACFSQGVVGIFEAGNYNIRQANAATVIVQRPRPSDLTQDERVTLTFEQVGSNLRITQTVVTVIDPDTASEKTEPIERHANAAAIFESGVKKIASNCASGTSTKL